MDEFEKKIYNTFLAVSRSIQNKPFKLRDNFSDFEKKPECLYVKKLAIFFKKHKHLNINSFFEAPYYVLNDNYFPLDFYCSFKAVSIYKIYHDQYLIDNLDSDVFQNKIKESILYITNFCKDRGIKLMDYINHKDDHSLSYSFLNHLNERKIIVYILFSFPNFEKIVKGISPEIKHTIAPILLRVSNLRTKLYISSRAKKNINLFKKYVDK